MKAKIDPSLRTLIAKRDEELRDKIRVLQLIWAKKKEFLKHAEKEKLCYLDWEDFVTIIPNFDKAMPPYTDDLIDRLREDCLDRLQDCSKLRTFVSYFI